MNFLSHSKNNLDEVVFEHRNKQYGAYALRKSYDEHLLKAAASSMGLLLLSGSLFYVSTLFRKQVEPFVESIRGVTLDNTLERQIEIVLDDDLLPHAAPKNTDNGRYRIVRDVQATQPLTTPADPTRPLNPDGPETPATAGTQPGTTEGAGTLSTTAPVEHPQAYATFAAIMPAFEGGPEAMARFIRRELVYPPDAVEFGKEGKVVVTFVVQADGSITDIEVMKGFGFGSEEAARNVIERMPKWIPGKQNGKVLPVKLILPLQFQLH